MLNTLVIVWRESLEALLVIGVLLAWSGRQPEPAPLQRGLAWGIAAGIALAGLLGGATLLARSELEGQALEAVRLAVVFGAAVLIVQMVSWMRRHGPGMRRELEGLADRAGSGRGLAAVAALAVAREGAETVVFLYGIGMEGSEGLAGRIAAAAAGLLVAVGCAWLISRGTRRMNPRRLFLASEILLLLVAASLVSAGVDQMATLDGIEVGFDPVWDSSALLDDAAGVGRVLADFAGYRSRPSAPLLATQAIFWAAAVAMLSRAGRRRGPMVATEAGR